MPTVLGDDLGISVGDLDLNTSFNFTVTHDASGQDTVIISVDPSAVTPVGGTSPDAPPSVPASANPPLDAVTPPAPDSGTALPVAGTSPDAAATNPAPTVTVPDAVIPPAPDGGSTHSPPPQVDPTAASADMVSALHSYSTFHNDVPFN